MTDIHCRKLTREKYTVSPLDILFFTFGICRCWCVSPSNDEAHHLTVL